MNRLVSTGTGSLIVFDPARIDMNHLRTQDMVDIYPDSNFSILGRVAHSTLKGCSLLANDPLLDTDSNVTDAPEEEIPTARKNIVLQIDKD